VLAIAEQVEDRETVLVHDDSLAVDDAGLDGQACHGVHDQRIAVGEIIAVTRDEADSVTVLPRQDAEAVVLDYVNPAKSRPRVLDRPRQRSVSRPLARRDLGRSGPTVVSSF
jgi:hypothetical protein